MDRVTVFALLVAGVSVLVSAVSHGQLASTVGHGCSLILPLAVIAFPKALDIGFRRSWRGFAHGGPGPAPATILRIAAWLLLIILVAVHHYLAFAQIRWPVDR